MSWSRDARCLLFEMGCHLAGMDVLQAITGSDGLGSKDWELFPRSMEGAESRVPGDRAI